MESTSSDDFTRMLAAKMNKRVLNAMHEAKAELGEAGEGINLKQDGRKDTATTSATNAYAAASTNR